MVLPSSPQPSTFRVTTAAPTARHHAPTSAKSFFAFLNHAGRGPLLSCPLISKSFSFFSFLTTHSTSRLETRSIATLCVCAHYLSIYTFNNSNIRMAPLGPLARFLAQLVVPVVAVLARAIPAAYGQALQNARKAGVDAAEASAPVFGKRISRAEALQVLNLTEKEAANPEAIQRQFDRYFAANEVSKGGSFYLQSKIYRAKELLTEFQEEKRREEMKQ